VSLIVALDQGTLSSQVAAPLKPNLGTHPPIAHCNAVAGSECDNKSSIMIGSACRVSACYLLHAPPPGRVVMPLVICSPASSELMTSVLHCIH
jgi:hypothetical protein